jgi:hypothetical protein
LKDNETLTDCLERKLWKSTEYVVSQVLRIVFNAGFEVFLAHRMLRLKTENKELPGSSFKSECKDFVNFKKKTFCK